jgi:SAM-dependent methyltransferase
MRAGGRTKRSVDLTILGTIYEGLSGFNANTAAVTGNYKTTYGEVTPEGIKALDGLFTAQTPVRSLPVSQRTFYDLGCGVGKVVVGMALLHSELQCRGFEIVPDRVNFAQTALQRVKQRGVAGRIRYTTTSFLDSSVNLADAGWVYISNLCFDAETQEGLARKLEREAKPGAVVICSKDMPFTAGGKWHLKASGQRVPMSWSSESNVYVYRCEA